MLHLVAWNTRHEIYITRRKNKIKVEILIIKFLSHQVRYNFPISYTKKIFTTLALKTLTYYSSHLQKVLLRPKNVRIYKVALIPRSLGAYLLFKTARTREFWKNSLTYTRLLSYFPASSSLYSLLSLSFIFARQNERREQCFASLLHSSSHRYVCFSLWSV